MARYRYGSVLRDGNGCILASATVSVYLAGTTTAASVYTASSGGTAVNSVTTDTDGSFEFYVDESDYGYGQLFKLSGSLTGYTALSIDNVEVVKPNWTTSAGTLKFWTYQADALADDGTVSLPDATSGILMVSCNAEGGVWVVQSSGAVAAIAGTTNTASTDSDGDLCLYDGGTGAVLKNRLGATGEIRALYAYN
ncbi:MAG: hypothetical protein WC455_18675 [Dehalococcoidia bacterium]|jgi:hypothetical protein